MSLVSTSPASFGHVSSRGQSVKVIVTAALFATSMVPTTSSFPQVQDFSFDSYAAGTWSGQYSAGLLTTDSKPRTASTPTSTADIMAIIRDEAGLTWDQLARLFDVSRRSVHLWANGARMNSHNQQHALNLYKWVQSVPGETPEQRRIAILSPGADGHSLFDRWKSEAMVTAQEINPDVAPDAGLRV